MCRFEQNKPPKMENLTKNEIFHLHFDPMRCKIEVAGEQCQNFSLPNKE